MAAKSRKPQIVRTKTQATGGVTKEELAQMRLLSKQWIDVAFQTGRVDRPALIEAIKGVYRVHDLAEPVVVVVPSPYVMVMAGSVAALLHMRATYAATAAATCDATRDATRAATAAAVDDATYVATRAATDAATDAATRVATAAATYAAVDDATRAATCDATYAAVDDATRAATCDATRDATRDAARDATAAAIDAEANSAVRAAAYSATREVTAGVTCDSVADALYRATYVAAVDATGAAIDDAVARGAATATAVETDEATAAATRTAVDAAVEDIVYASTRFATESAMCDAVRAATYNATDAVTSSAVDAASRAAADAVISAAAGNVVGNALYTVAGQAHTDILTTLSQRFSVDITQLCAVVRSWYRFYQGGNMWAAWECYLTAFRDVIGLDLPAHAKYKYWEAAAKLGGFRYMHRDFCMVCEFPDVIKLDDQNRPHCEDGPSHRWPDGWAMWYINGVCVDEQIVMRPETQTIDQINQEENADVRALRISRYGWVRYLQDSQARCIDWNDNEIEGTKEALYVTSYGDARLVATCATGRIFAMGVPPHIKTCQEAQAWLASNRGFKIVGRT